VAVWLVLLAGCVLFGATIVAALVAPRTVSPAAALASILSLTGGVTAFGIIAQRYNTPEAIAAAIATLIAGIGVGFAVAATALPHLARRPAVPHRAQGVGQTSPDRRAVVLVCCAEPERYSARAIAARQNQLAESAAIEVPAAALPFVFFADKARYRAVGGRAPGAAAARALAVRLAALMPEGARRVELAWCHAPESLALRVSELGAEGVGRVAVVVLGAPESASLDEVRELLDRAVRGAAGPEVSFGPPVWNDRRLPERLAERVMALTPGATPDEVGVVLVDAGAPPLWERRYSLAGETDNYFNQRVRMLLVEAGIAEQHVRVAWLDWQTPDVTEAVRHLAALGCTRIVVMPSTIALPTLETALDLGHAVAMARVPDEVQVVRGAPWADDEGFADAACRSALEALGEAPA